MNLFIIRPTLLLLIFWLFPGGGAATAAPERRTWQVDGMEREALVALPSNPSGKEDPIPLVFIFHGHGGTMQHAARIFSLHTEWPEAVCIYMQGLPTVGRLTDPEGKKSGWQARAGDGGDRDLKFFDAALASLKQERKIDPLRIYATGHSNGGAFTYLLWGKRGEIFAAMAPSAAAATRQFKDLKPKPVLHFAGRMDPLVKFAWQEKNISLLRRLNHCNTTEPLVLGMNAFSPDARTPVFAWIQGRRA